MKLSVSDFIEKTESNDFKVYSVGLDIAKAEFNISFEGVYFFKEKTSIPIIMEKGGYIFVASYISFEARYFSPQDRLWRTLDYPNIEMINEINKKSYENEVLKIAGTGKSGYWVEYLIKGGKVEIYLKD